MGKLLTSKEESYAQAYVLTKGDKVQAYKDAGYSLKLNSAEMSVQADKLYNKPKINLRIKELQKASLNEFVKSKEDKLKILDDLIDACKKDDEEKGVLNATAVIQAIKEHNLMQGDNAPTQIENKTVKSFSDMYNDGDS